MSYYAEVADRLLKQYAENIEKSAFSAAGAASAGIVELDFAEIINATNDPQTPLVNAIGSTIAKAITHRWRKYTYRSAASNKHQEGSAAAASVSVTPAATTNTCQIIKGTIEVTGSAQQEAANGVYGTGQIDDLAFQIEAETAGIMQDLELAILNGVEDTSDGSEGGGSERAMKGIIGAVGTWNGFVQTTRTDASAAAFSQPLVDALLAAIWAQNPRVLPDTLLGSLAFCQKVSTYATMMRYSITDPAQVANLPAGQRVTQYVAPWGGILDIMPHPLNTNSATAANNYFAALSMKNMARADFRSLRRRPVPSSNDGDLYEILWEGCLEFRGETGTGLVRNFAQIS